MKTLAFFVLLALSSGVTAASIADAAFARDGTFYFNHEQGWYWYQDPAPKKEENTPEPPSQTSAPAALTAAWVREMLPRYKDLAWNEPTAENVEAYFLIQRFAMDRSQAFADMAQRVVSGNPYLDENSRRPINTYGIRAVDRQAGQMMDRMLAKVARHAGLFFFFKSDCSYCEAQAPLIKLLEEVDGFSVLAISVDGQALKSVSFAHTRTDAGQAQQLQVTQTPSLFLVTPTGHFENLGQGVMTLEDLKRRLLIGAVRAGILTEADIEATRPIIHSEAPSQNLSEQLKPLMIQAHRHDALWDKDGFIEPKKLLGLLNRSRLSGEIHHDEDVH